MKKRIWFFLAKSRTERELDAEIGFHLEAVIREKVAAGASPEAARREALIEFGGGQQIRRRLGRLLRPFRM